MSRFLDAALRAEAERAGCLGYYNNRDRLPGGKRAVFSGFSTPWKIFWRVFHAMENFFPHRGKSGKYPQIRIRIIRTTIHQFLVIHARFSFEHIAHIQVEMFILRASQTKTLMATKNTKRHKD